MACPLGWKGSPAGVCYLRDDAPQTHFECALQCAARNASLACVGSAAEQLFLERELLAGLPFSRARISTVLYIYISGHRHSASEGWP